jgi:Spy/CpxP family protein refolding chaperone
MRKLILTAALAASALGFATSSASAYKGGYSHGGGYHKAQYGGGYSWGGHHRQCHWERHRQRVWDEYRGGYVWVWRRVRICH